THWTSHRSVNAGSKREEYADLVYGRDNALYHRNAKADILVCDDLNDGPDNLEVRDHLHTSSLHEVRSANVLRSLIRMAGRDPPKKRLASGEIVALASR